MTSGTHITYYHLCHRKLWLHAHGMHMENIKADANPYVEEGRFISDTAYARRPSRWHELDLGNVRIDHYDPRENLVREVKKSPKLEHAHIAQVRYYLYCMEQAGLRGASGLIEYPKHRKTTRVPALSDTVRSEIRGWEEEIRRIADLQVAPPVIMKGYCTSCAFRDFCYV